MGKNILYRSVSIFIAVMFFGIVNSQVNFSYTVDPGPCRPYTVHFTGNAPTSTSWKWYFGDGDSSTLQNPVHIYKHGSRQDVTFMAWDGGTFLGNAWQNVYLPGGPSQIETSKDSVCMGDNVYFYTNGGNYNNNSWDWGEGAGFESNSYENNHTFSSTGNKMVRLKFDVPGCGPDTLSRQMIVTNTAIPSNNFYSNPWEPCPGEQVEFATSNTYAIYLWDFGDGQTSVESRPHHSYATTGTKNVTLSVTNACGKSNSGSQNITVNSNKKWSANEVNMWVSKMNPCPNERVDFNYCCSQVYYSVWRFGDGDSVVNSQNADHQYASNGTYNAVLYLRNACGNDSTITRMITVGTPAYFGGNPQLQTSADSVCPNEDVMFEVNNISYTGNEQFLWTFGDGNIENNQNTRMSHSYSSTGNMNMTVKITNVCGKDTTLNKLIKVKNDITPVLSLGDNWGSPSSSACPNDSVLFYAYGGKSYLWEFGDGQSTTFTVPVYGGDRMVDVAGHKYSAKAVYKVKLTLTNNCNKSAKDSMMFPIVDTAMPSGDFNYESSMPMVCSNIRFMAYGGSTYKYYFGDGDSLVTSDMYCYHQYRAPGSYNISLKIINNCGNFIMRNRMIFIQDNFMGVAGYDPGDTAKACPGDSITFYTLNNGSNYTFYFGDGNSTTTVIPFRDPSMGAEMLLAKHSYSAIGQYQVRITYTNGCGASAADTTEVSIGNTGNKPQADFAITTDEYSRTTCRDIEFLGIGGVSYKWKFGDGDSLITTNTTAKHKYQATGPYNITLIVTNGCGMKDTSDVSPQNQIEIIKSDMGVTDTASCAGDSLLFYAESGSNFLWKFGDGQQGTVMSDLVTPGGVYKTIKHAYAANGTYKTIVTLTNGCGLLATDSFMVNVTGSRPVSGGMDIWMDGGSTAACKPLQMMATGGLIYKWHFGDGDSLNTTEVFITHAYTSAGNFQVSCKVINGCGNSAIYNNSVTITSMIVNGTPYNPLCNADASGSISSVASGGTTPRSYLWNNNDTNQLATGLIAGDYTVTVRDHYGCEVSKSFTLTDPPAITMTPSITPTGCGTSTGGATVTPSGGTGSAYSYLWSTGETINTISNKASGVYTVTIKDVNLCPEVFSVAINTTTPPAVTLGAFSDVCANGTVVTLSGGSPVGGTYKVNGTGATAFDPKLYGQGTYNITYTYVDGGNCSGTDLKTLIVNPVPDVTIGTYDPICENEPVLVFDNGYPTGGTYKLDGVVAVSIDPAVASEGNHQVIYSYTDGKGCAAADTQAIEGRSVITPTLAAFSTVCTNSAQVTLSGGLPIGGSYELEGVPATTFNPILFAPGTYNVKYIYTNNGCSEDATNTIEVKTAIAITGITANPLCNAGTDGSVDISITGGNGAYTYDWNNNTTNQDVSGLAAGAYSVIVTDGNSCTGNKSFMLTEPTAIVANPSATNTSDCVTPDGTASVAPTGGTGGYTYLWSPGGSALSNISGLAAGIYSVTIKDANNCPKTVSVTISEPGAPVVTLAAFTDKCSNEASFALSGGLPATGTYKVNGTVATDFDPKAYGAGTYSITYTYALAGCEASDIKTLKVNAAPAVSLGADNAICKNGAAIQFNYGFPAGGTYKLDGGAATSLVPTSVTAGNHEVIYSVTNASSCTAADTQTINVKAVTAASLATFPTQCKEGAVYTLAGGLPAGGIYKMGGATITTFDPAVNPSGSYSIKYIYTNNGCSDTATNSLALADKPSATFATTFADMCNNAASLAISGGAPAGGSYMINGNTVTSIIPSTLTVATHNILYIYEVAGCSDTAVQTVVIKAVTPAALSAITDKCKNTASVAFSGGTPAGGTYQIDGTAATNIVPVSLTAATHTVSYLYTVNGCSDTADQSLVILPVTAASLASFPAICKNSGVLTLTGGTPAGGIYRVGGTTVTTFDPSTKAPGTYNVAYIYTAGGCNDTARKSIVVDTITPMSLAAITPVCSNKKPITLGGGLPTGGTYKVDDSVATTFDPTKYAAGNYTVKYTFVNGACSDSLSKTLIVKKAPVVALAAFDSICSNAGALTLSGGTPSGGVYLIDTTVATSFTPSTAGTFTIAYAFADTNLCADTATRPIVVKTCVGLGSNNITSVEIYPNPTKGLLNVTISTPVKDVVLKVVNTAGQTLSIEKLSGLNTIHKVLDIGRFVQGIYMIVIYAGDEIITTKVVLIN